MYIKIKPSRPKKRRRGNRLIVDEGEARTVYVADGDGFLMPVERRIGDETFRTIRRSPCGRMAVLAATGDAEGPAEYLIVDDAFIAKRFPDFDPNWWMFRIGPDGEFDSDGTLHVSAGDALDVIANKALLLAIAARDDGRVVAVPEPVADFLGIVPMLCEVSKLLAVLDDPRFARLREFDFRLGELPADLGYGRRAENAARHEHSNYDAMLRDAGGLLFPEQYEPVRRGVDLLVGAMLRERKPAK